MVTHLVGKTTHLVGKATHLVGKATHLVGKTTHLVGKTTHLVGKATHPSGKATQPRQQTIEIAKWLITKGFTVYMCRERLRPLPKEVGENECRLIFFDAGDRIIFNHDGTNTDSTS